MLGNLFFAIKMLLATIAIIFVMQIRIGSSSLEEHAYAMIHSSTYTQYLERVAHGATQAWHDSVRKVSGWTSSSSPHHRR